MKIADMHGDTIFQMMDNRKNGIDCELAKNQIMVARKLLTSDEYTSLKKLIFQDDTIPHNSLFDIE